MSVAALKLVCLLLNLRDTFKALKKPTKRRPEAFIAEDAGDVSVSKAIPRMGAARRERMRETLMIWVVWIAWWYTEAVLDWLIGWILPFYTQFKLLFWVYLITTRSFGASGLYLNLLKPVVDIYATPIDLTLLLISHTLALILYMTVKAPLNLVHAAISSVRNKEPEVPPRPTVDTDAGQLKKTIKEGQAKVHAKAQELRDLRATGAVRQRARVLEKAAAAVAPTPMAPGGYRTYPELPKPPPATNQPKSLPKFPSLPPTLYDFNDEMERREQTGTLKASPPVSAVPKLVLQSKPAQGKPPASTVGRQRPAAAAPPAADRPVPKVTRKRKAVEDIASEPTKKPVVKRAAPARKAPTRTAVATPAKKRKLNDGDAEYIDEPEESLPKRTPRRKAAIVASEAIATPKPRARRKPKA